MWYSSPVTAQPRGGDGAWRPGDIHWRWASNLPSRSRAIRRSPSSLLLGRSCSSSSVASCLSTARCP